MWKDWKEKISNFFFEEIEEDEELESIDSSIHSQEKISRNINTKITYEYPKKETPPFRFPLIPDKIDVNKEVINKTLYQEQETSKRKRIRNRRRSREISRNDSLTKEYHRKKVEKELEDIPAYIRRRKVEERIEQNVENESKYKITQIKYTQPDELDRVFQQQDKFIENVCNESNHPIEKNDNALIQEEISTTRSDNQTMEQKMNRNDQMEVGDQNKQSQIHKESNVLDFQVDDDLEDHAEKLSIQVPDYLLNDPVKPSEDDSQWVEEQKSLLAQTLKHFNVDAKIVNITQGPSVTRIEIQPALGVKVSKIRNLTDDIKLNLAAKDIRIEAPIPGKNTVGIEVPNQFPQVVHLQEIIETKSFKDATSPLTIALGLTIEGKPLITNIDKMPHGLIAGATGSGKSVCINTILLSLLYKASYDEVKFLLIDPKMVELTPYNGIPHLIAPVITDAKAATMSLKWAVNEMETRYERFVQAGVRNIIKYNEKMEREKGEKLPFIVIVIDELADLMIVSPQEVEDSICRIAQKARASGIHLLLATQRPSVDVITGLIKANIPTRIAFSVSSQVDSRTIIDTNGAEKLLGKGDMLFVENGANKSVRLQGPFVSDEEIDRITNYMRSIAKPNYLFEQEQLLIEIENEEEDELLEEAITFVVEQDQASTSLLQRRFRIGYNRAARLIDTLENKGIISAQNGSKPRDVLIARSQIEDLR